MKRIAIMNISVVRIVEFEGDFPPESELVGRQLIPAKGLGFLNSSFEKKGLDAAAVKVNWFPE